MFSNDTFYFKTIENIKVKWFVFHWCLYNKQNITCPLMDMNFIFSWSTRYLTRSLRSLVRYRVDHSKIKFISTRGHVISSIQLSVNRVSLTHIDNGAFCYRGSVTPLRRSIANRRVYHNPGNKTSVVYVCPRVFG